MKPRGGPPLWLMNSRGGPPFLGCMLMNSRGGPPILRGGPPLGTISMDQAVYLLKIRPIFVGSFHNFGRSDFSGKMLISNRCIGGLMPNLIKKSLTVSTVHTQYTFTLCTCI